MTYTVILVREADGGYCVHVPALKGCHTEGDTLPEALDMARDAIEGYLESLEQHDELLPPDVATVTFDWRNGTEALVYRVTVGEAVGVA
ncbi:MAG: type II toxin-antitoxin system HicB family antitoxin [Armatimonadetes bacterium]|nr:type II toxin-antitoxin system HicB family antitoxin [Armatimonadota bacterium]